MKVVIIGGVAGGASAAARLRRLDEAAEIIIFERSGFISYANCGLPYYIGGTIEDESDLTLQTPQSFWRRFRIDARVRHEVTAIDREKKTVSVLNLETGERLTESYDKLILSPGAVPVRPKLPGIESKRIQTLRTVEDTLRIRAMAVGLKLKSALWSAAASSALRWPKTCAGSAWRSASSRCSRRCSASSTATWRASSTRT